MESDWPQRIRTLNRTMRGPIAIGLCAPILWLVIWTVVAINLWRLDLESPPFSVFRCLLVILPYAVYAQGIIAFFPRLSRVRWTIAAGYVLLFPATWILGGNEALLASILAVGLLHLAALLTRSDAGFASVEVNGAAETEVETGPEPVAEPNNGDPSNADQISPQATIEQGTQGVAPTSTAIDSEKSLTRTLEPVVSSDEATEDAEDCEGLSDDPWLQQWTRRPSPAPVEDSRAWESVEWFARHHWSNERGMVEFHILFQPAFAESPELNAEVVEGTGQVKIVAAFPHGVRLELKPDHNVADSLETPVLIWVSATGPVQASS